MLLDMEHKRIQKLLLSEYCDFSDRILIESPFAETTRDGRGLCQVALGLTPSKLVVAADILKNNSDFTCRSDLDPSIESFELVSIYPLEFIALSVFCRRKRRTLKARLVDGRAKYYELGGMERRNVYWALWMENVRGLNEKKQDGSSLSETTAASSSSASTVYLLSSGFEQRRKNNGEGGGGGGGGGGGSKYRVWARYGGAGDGQACSWRRKDIYLGPSYEELSQGYYTPVPVRFAGASIEEVTEELGDGTAMNLVRSRRKTRIAAAAAAAGTTNNSRSSSSWPCTRVPMRKCVQLNGEAAGQLCDVLNSREDKKSQRSCQVLNWTIQEWESNNNENKNRDETASEEQERRRVNPACLFSRGKRIKRKHKSGSPRKHGVTGGTSVAPKLSRFGFGIGENCRSGLYLEPWEEDRKAVYRRRRGSGEALIDRSPLPAPPPPPPPPPPHTLIESSVCVWENPGDGKFRRKRRIRHPRRCALATAAHFFHALGPWSVQPGERESVQRERACSAVSIRRQPVEPELRLPVSKRQLAASVSMNSLLLDRGKTGSSSGMFSSSKARARGVILFWTPEYWYRPRAATAAYKELRRHLALMRDFRARKERGKKGRYFWGIGKADWQGPGGQSTANLLPAECTSGRFLEKIFSSKDTTTTTTTTTTTRRNDKRKMNCREGGEGVAGSSQLRRLLRMDLRITAWDLDSLTIARQLTLIDRELFLRIPCAEIEILLNEKSSRNAPNLGAWIAFGHRISCLTTSEVLATKKLDMRTRILSRFINAADKCYALGNFHSCRSILAGLESPPVYRLDSTWSHLRTHHSTRYETMQRLCQIYRNTRSRSYGRAWQECERKPPFLPYVGHLLDMIIYQDIEDVPRRSRRSLSTDDTAARRRVSSMIENARYKITSKTSVTRVGGGGGGKQDEITKNQHLIKDRRSLRERIVSAAISQIGYSKLVRQPPVAGEKRLDEKTRWTTKEEELLARKFYTRWRRSILARRILAEKEAKIRAMDPKKLRVMRIGYWLCECQKHCQEYHFPGHSLAWEFLLKARYREDKENFFISLKLEPPCG